MTIKTIKMYSENKFIAGYFLNICRYIKATMITVLLMPNIVYSFDLLVKVTELKSDEGNVCFALFDDKELTTFPSVNHAVKRLCIPSNKNGVEYKFTNLAFGYYAVSVFHDINNTRILERNSFGLPLKAWGFSNNIRPIFRAPKFNEVKFLLDDNKVIEIECTMKMGKK